MKLFSYFSKVTFSIFIVLSIPTTTQAQGTSSELENLWITEIWPATGQVEVTNISDQSITTPRNLPFCHGRRYGDSIPSNTVFAAGQSRIFTILLGNRINASDLWIYSSSSFGSRDALLNGLVWGGAPPANRISVASSGNDWDGNTSFVAVPSSSQSISLTGPDPRSAANWSVGTPNLGTFTPFVESPPVQLTFTLLGDSIRLSWTGGLPPYLVEDSTDLEEFFPISQRIDATEFTIPLGEESARFFRVVSEAPPEAEASYRATLRSTWSSLSHLETPPSPMFGPVIGATHNNNVSFWSAGSLGSNGLEELVEGTGTTQFISEINSAISTGSAGELINANGITQLLGETSFEFTARAESPLLTIASRLSSSPDWFAGVSERNLLDANGNFISSATIMVSPYDAGTENGNSFDTNGLNTSPPELISSLFDQGPFAPSFLVGPHSGPIPVAALVIERVETPLP